MTRLSLSLVAINFVMPSIDALITIMLLVAVLSVAAMALVTYVVKTEPFRTLVLAICGLIGVVILLQTFTTWRG